MPQGRGETEIELASLFSEGSRHYFDQERDKPFQDGGYDRRLPSANGPFIQTNLKEICVGTDPKAFSESLVYRSSTLPAWREA